MKRYKSQLPIKRTALTLMGLATLGFAMIWPHSEAAAIDLRYNSVVEGSTITLGDIFSGLNGPEHAHKASRVLGAAPRPGTDMVLNARTLMRIAVALDLPWRPGSGADQVVLRRAASVIDQDMIETALGAALENEGLDGRYNIIIPSNNAEMIIAHNQPASVEVRKINFDPRYNRFEAELAAPSVANPIATMNVSGSVERLREVPVVRQTLRHGDVIGLRDLDYVAVPVNRLKHNIVLEPKDLVGMTPRRLLTPDQPIVSNEIEAPLIVNRGELVTMVYREGPLLLTAKGKALENGSIGDAIRVVNLNSSRTLEAVVTNTKEVEVKSF